MNIEQGMSNGEGVRLGFDCSRPPRYNCAPVPTMQVHGRPPSTLFGSLFSILRFPARLSPAWRERLRSMLINANSFLLRPEATQRTAIRAPALPSVLLLFRLNNTPDDRGFGRNGSNH